MLLDNSVNVEMITFFIQCVVKFIVVTYDECQVQVICLVIISNLLAF